MKDEEKPKTKLGRNLPEKKESSSNNIDETYDDDFEDFEADKSDRNRPATGGFGLGKPDPFSKKPKTPSQSDGIEELSGFEDKYDEDEDFF